MARITRIDFPGSAHHVYGRGNGKQPIFRDDEDRRFFLRRLGELKGETGFQLLAWCLMTNHYHLVIQSSATPLRQVMHRLLTAYARVFNDRWTVVGHPFQGRYGDRLIKNDSDLKGVIRYVHMNPVAAGLCSEPDQWPWSGQRDVTGRATALIDRDFVVSLFEGALESYLDFMRQPARTPERPSLPDLAGGRLAVLRSRSRDHEHQQSRRAFILDAIELGYKQREIAAFLGRTEAAVSLFLKR